MKKSINKDILKFLLIFGILGASLLISLTGLNENNIKIGKKVTENISLSSDFFSKAFKPLFAEKYTKEDIFDFALNDGLNIKSKSPKRILLSVDSTGKSLKIENLYLTSGMSYERFISVLDIEKKEIEEIDSLLEAFKPEVLKNIGFNGEALVVSTDIYSVNKRLKIELLRAIDLLENYELNTDEKVERNVVYFSKKSAIMISACLEQDTSGKGEIILKLEKLKEDINKKFTMSLAENSLFFKERFNSEKNEIDLEPEIINVFRILRSKLKGVIPKDSKELIAKGKYINKEKLANIVSRKLNSKPFIWEGINLKSDLYGNN